MVRVMMFMVFVCVPGWVFAQVPLPVSPDCRVNRPNQGCESMAKKYSGILGGSCSGATCQKIGMVWTCNLGIGFDISDEPELGYRDTREANFSDQGSTVHNTNTVSTKCGTKYACWCNPLLMIHPLTNPCQNNGNGDPYFPIESWIGPINCTGEHFFAGP